MTYLGMWLICSVGLFLSDYWKGEGLSQRLAIAGCLGFMWPFVAMCMIRDWNNEKQG